MKYRNFMPKDYLEIKDKKEKHLIERLIILIILPNLILLPKSVNVLYEKEKSVPVVNIKNEEIDYRKNEILDLLSIINDDMEYIEIKDGMGIIRVKEKEAIYKINEEIKINNISEEGGRYLLGIEL